MYNYNSFFFFSFLRIFSLILENILFETTEAPNWIMNCGAELGRRTGAMNWDAELGRGVSLHMRFDLENIIYKICYYRISFKNIFKIIQKNKLEKFF